MIAKLIVVLGLTAISASVLADGQGRSTAPLQAPAVAVGLNYKSHLGTRPVGGLGD